MSIESQEHFLRGWDKQIFIDECNICGKSHYEGDDCIPCEYCNEIHIPSKCIYCGDTHCETIECLI